MLYAIEWIRQLLLAAYQFVVGFLEALTLPSIGAFLTRWPAMLVLYLLAGLALVLVGFRCHKLVSGLVGGAVMGYFGWQTAAAINSSYISSSILLALIFGAVGLFLFYMLFVINMGLGTFFVCFALVRWVFYANLVAAAIAGAVATMVYCILLIGRPIIRTPIAGGALLALVCFHYFGPVVVVGVFALSTALGIVLQFHLHKRHEIKQEEARNFRPNAPSPPTPEEIAAEIAEEEAERAARQDGGAHPAEVMTRQ